MKKPITEVNKAELSGFCTSLINDMYDYIISRENKKHKNKKDSIDLSVIKQYRLKLQFLRYFLTVQPNDITITKSQNCIAYVFTELLEYNIPLSETFNFLSKRVTKLGISASDNIRRLLPCIG